MNVHIVLDGEKLEHPKRGSEAEPLERSTCSSMSHMSLDSSNGENGETTPKSTSHAAKTPTMSRWAGMPRKYSLLTGVTDMLMASSGTVLGVELSTTKLDSPFPSPDTLPTATGVPTVNFALDQDHRCNEDDAARRAVKERAIQRQVEMRRTRRLTLRKTMRRAAVAQNRRHFHEILRDVQSACMWMAIVCELVFAARLYRQLGVFKSLRTLRQRLRPVLQLKIKKLWRRSLRRKAERDMQRPKLSVLKGDKMLQLFGDEHLESAIQLLTVRVYCKDEWILFEGSDSHECFIIDKGQVEVLIRNDNGKNECVCTLGPNAVFGSIGMISGEPRMASIRAKTDEVRLWCLARGDFDRATVSPQAKKNAMAIVTELHEANLGKLYKNALSREILAKYGLFHGVNVEDLENLTGGDHLQPHAYKAGDVLLREGEKPTACYILLRGCVAFHKLERLGCSMAVSEKTESTVVPHPSAKREISDAEKLHTLCDVIEVPHTDRANRKTYFVDLVAQGKKEVVAAPFLAPTQPSSVNLTAYAACSNSSLLSNQREVAQVGAKAIIALAPMLLGEASPFTIISATSTDVMQIHKQDLLKVMMLLPNSLYQMRRNAVNIHTLYYPPLTKAQLVAAVFGSTGISVEKLPDTTARTVEERRASRTTERWGFAAHSKSFRAMPKFIPVIMEAGEMVAFTPSCRDVFVVTAGFFEDTVKEDVSYPFIWPAAAFSYFGGYSLCTRAGCRLEAWKTSRSEIVALIDSATEHAGQITAFLAKCYEERVGKPPQFETLEPPAGTVLCAENTAVPQSSASTALFATGAGAAIHHAGSGKPRQPRLPTAHIVEVVTNDTPPTPTVQPTPNATPSAVQLPAPVVTSRRSSESSSVSSRQQAEAAQQPPPAETGPVAAHGPALFIETPVPQSPPRKPAKCSMKEAIIRRQKGETQSNGASAIDALLPPAVLKALNEAESLVPTRVLPTRPASRGNQPSASPAKGGTTSAIATTFFAPSKPKLVKCQSVPLPSLLRSLVERDTRGRELFDDDRRTLLGTHQTRRRVLSDEQLSRPFPPVVVHPRSRSDKKRANEHAHDAADVQPTFASSRLQHVALVKLPLTARY